MVNPIIEADLIMLIIISLVKLINKIIIRIIMMTIRRRVKEVHPKMVFQQTVEQLTESKSQEREGPRMIIGAEISTANIAINNICLILHSILISNKSIAKGQMDKLSHYPQVAEDEVVLRKILIKDMIPNQKSSFVILNEKVVQ